MRPHRGARRKRLCGLQGVTPHPCGPQTVCRLPEAGMFRGRRHSRQMVHHGRRRQETWRHNQRPAQDVHRGAHRRLCPRIGSLRITQQSPEACGTLPGIRHYSPAATKPVGIFFRKQSFPRARTFYIIYAREGKRQTTSTSSAPPACGGRACAP